MSFQLQSVSLLFVDNPVGTGYSYVDNERALTTNVTQIASDMMVLLKTVFQDKLTEFQVKKNTVIIYCTVNVLKFCTPKCLTK